MEETYNLSHLKELEAESIHIIREVAAEFENPVMLYSIGKDSSVIRTTFFPLLTSCRSSSLNSSRHPLEQEK